MSDNNEFSFDFEDILAEFSSFSSNLSSDQSAAPAEEPVYEAPVYVEEPVYEEPVEEAVYEEPVYEEPAAEAGAVQPEEPETVFEKPAPPRRASLSGVNRKRSVDAELLGYRHHRSEKKRDEQPPVEELKEEKRSKIKIPSLPKKEKAVKEKPVKVMEVKDEPKKEKAEIRINPVSILKNFIGTVFAVISAFALIWVLVNVHPESGAVTNSTTDAKLDLVGRLDVYMNNFASDALGDLSYIKKIYTIDESALVAPKPNPACYGVTTNPADIDAVIENAAELIGDQKLTWDPNVEFFPGSKINYYLDDTIFVLAWKEIRENKVCTCSEVFIAHGSQLRRKLAGDAYGSSVQVYATKMATEANSVVAINGDFYAFRDLGITGYQRTIYRVNPAQVDSCFFTADGDMLFSYAGELMGEGEAQKFMDDNNCTFAIAFGPVLIDDGQLRKIQSYPIGEINTTYSRSAIGMLGERHYLLMTVNYEEGFTKTSTIHQLGEFMAQKGCIKAYTLDGGQTSVMVMKGETLNKVDWGEERIMSDIIYFATAIPEEEVAQ